MKVITHKNEEPQVKKWIKDVLKEYNVYYFMPVQSGIGGTGVDFHCVVNWCNIPLAFFIEAKEFGKEPTTRQSLFINERKKHQNATSFIIDGMVGVNKLKVWLEHLKRQTEAYWLKRVNNLHRRAEDGHP